MVDVAKSTVVVSQEVTARIQEFMEIARKTADTLWREKDVLSDQDIKELFDESNSLIASRRRLIIDLAKRRQEQQVNVETADGGSASGPKTKSDVKSRQHNIPYISPVQSLPEDVLYRPLLTPN